MAYIRCEGPLTMSTRDCKRVQQMYACCLTRWMFPCAALGHLVKILDNA